MAEIHPFRGVRYNQRKVSSLASVICPPYDIITSQMQQELYHRSQYNFVRLEDSRGLPQDTAGDSKYTRAAATLKEWLKEGILSVDGAPSVYLHDHYFGYEKKEYKRRSLITLVKLEEWDTMVVRPHEGAQDKPKSDRLNLLWALQANTSPILALFSDPAGKVASALKSQEAKNPIISLGNVDGERHNLWAITEPGVISQLSSYLAPQPIYIADGHHRYESALAYQRERRTCSESVSGDEAFNFVLMELVDFADPGLVILPPHRLVRGIPRTTLNELMAKLAAFFEIEKLPLGTPDVWKKVEAALAVETEVRLVLFGITRDQLLVLKLRNPAAAGKMMPYFHSELYKSLPVSVIDHIILEEMMGLNDGEATIAYSYNQQDAVNRVLDQEYQLAFLLAPIKSEVIKAVADAGDRMPRKSTYFYPKVAAGLVFNRLD